MTDNTNQNQTVNKNENEEIAQVVKEDEMKLREIQNLAQEKMDNTNLAKIDLSEEQKNEVDVTFKDVKDFRQLWEKITAPIDNIVAKTAKIIDSDPVMNVNEELIKTNKEVQWIYKDIIDNDSKLMKFMKSLPLIWTVASKFDEKLDEAKFNMKSLNEKIESIFDWFDTSYSSLNKSIDLQKDFLDWLENNMTKVESYKEYVEIRLNEFKTTLETVTDESEKDKLNMFVRNIEYFINNLNVLIWNLELAKKRLLIRLDSAVKLSLAMNSSRPIFKTLLSVAVIETSWQKAIDASMHSIQSMWSTIDNMSKDLTDKAIESNRKSEELTAKPILDANLFVENVTKLKEHFDTIEQYRKQVKIEAEEENKLFRQATEDLKKIKNVNKEDFDELQWVLNNNKW